MSRRLVQLYLGLAAYGLAGALMVRANLGLDPWNVLHQGLSDLSGLSLGAVVIGVGALVLLLWWPMRERPGLGTISNVIVVGLATDVFLGLIATPPGLAGRSAMLAAGIVVTGLATGAYIGAGFGPGPRDGLMTGLCRRTGWSVRVVRTSIELTVLGLGSLLGGTIGVGTVLFAFGVGPIAQLALKWLTPTPAPAAAAA